MLSCPSRLLLPSGLLALLLTGCTATAPGDTVSRAPAATTGPDTPPGAAPGTCWHREVRPAVVETVREQVLVQPPEIRGDGTMQRPGVFRTETRQAILRPRRASWIEIPCADDLPPDFTASLQRALKARGLLRGPVTGRMDRRTRAAVRAYQEASGGPDSEVLSLATARRLGLVVVADGSEG